MQSSLLSLRNILRHCHALLPHHAKGTRPVFCIPDFYSYCCCFHIAAMLLIQCIYTYKYNAIVNKKMWWVFPWQRPKLAHAECWLGPNSKLYIIMYAQRHTHTHTYIHTHTHTHTCAQSLSPMHAHTHIPTYMHIHIHTHTPAYMNTCTNTHTYACTYTTHTHNQLTL